MTNQAARGHRVPGGFFVPDDSSGLIASVTLRPYAHPTNRVGTTRLVSPRPAPSQQISPRPAPTCQPVPFHPPRYDEPLRIWPSHHGPDPTELFISVQRSSTSQPAVCSIHTRRVRSPLRTSHRRATSPPAHFDYSPQAVPIPTVLAASIHPLLTTQFVSRSDPAQPLSTEQEFT